MHKYALTAWTVWPALAMNSLSLTVSVSLLLHLSHLLFLFPPCSVISAVCCSCVPVLDVWHPACLFSSLLFAACMFILSFSYVPIQQNPCFHLDFRKHISECCECVTTTHQSWIHRSRVTNSVFIVTCWGFFLKQLSVGLIYWPILAICWYISIGICDCWWKQGK